MSKFLSVKETSLNFGKEVLNSHGFVVLKSQQQVFWSKAFKVKKGVGWVLETGGNELPPSPGGQWNLVEASRQLKGR